MASSAICCNSPSIPRCLSKVHRNATTSHTHGAHTMHTDGNLTLPGCFDALRPHERCADAMAFHVNKKAPRPSAMAFVSFFSSMSRVGYAGSFK